MNFKNLRENYVNYVGDISELGDFVEGAAKVWSDRVAFIHNEREKTYRQFRDDVVSLENILSGRGIKKGDKIALVCENSYEWVISYFAVIGVGGIIVPVDVEIPIPKIAKLLEENNIGKVICSPKYSGISDILDAEAFWTDELYLSVENNSGVPVFVKNFEYDPDDICQISFTSGTTGKMKAVMLNSRNIISDSIGASKIINAETEARLLLILPMNHMFTITASIIIPIMRGAKIYISSGKKYFLREFIAFKPDWLVIVPAIVKSVFKVAASAMSTGNNPDMMAVISNLKCIVCGGAPLDTKYIGIFKQFGINLVNGYGITECSPVVSVNYPDANIPGSCGITVDGCTIRINAPDEDGCGEIYVRGENVFCGYADETDNVGVFDDGWFRTGDIGRLDENGALFITGRKKNLIIMDNGKNVSSEELEEFIMNEVPEVEEIIVKGVDGIIDAVIYTSEGNPDKIKSDIMALNRELPSYKQIKRIEFREEPFEKTTSMKIIRV